MAKYQHKDMAGVIAQEQIPLHQVLPATNTYDLIKHGASINPEAIALSFIPSGEQYMNPFDRTYANLLGEINRTANMLRDLGLGSKDVVSYLLPNVPQTHFLLWGGQAAGIVNPINFLLEAHTIRDICQAAGTKILVALGEYPGLDIWQKVMSIRKDLPGVKAIVRGLGPSDEKNGVYGYDDFVHKYDADKLTFTRQIAPDDVATIFHTGGTTGTPKLAPRTHLNEAANALQSSLISPLASGETILSGLPLFHTNGTTVTGSSAFMIGGRVVILSPYGYRDPSVIKNFYKIVEKFRAVTFSAVPTVLAMLLATPKGDEDISSLRFAVCGAAPLSVELFQRFEEKTGMKIMEGYGLTEGLCVSSCNPYYGQRKIGSIGLRVPYQDMRVFKVDDQGKFVSEAKVDEIGSVCISGPNVFKGYTEDRHNTTLFPKEGWVNTGDLGRQDADGYIFLTGRKKELIIRGGHNIDPAVIEEILYSLPGVALAAAVGRPDPHAGEVPVAYVQLEPGADLDEARIMDHLTKNVGERAALPKEVVILGQLPLTPVGKMFKPAMRWDATRRTYERELAALGDEVQSLAVAVGEDKIHGTLATITVSPGQADRQQIAAKIAELLSLYTVKHEVVFV